MTEVTENVSRQWITSVGLFKPEIDVTMQLLVSSNTYIIFVQMYLKVYSGRLRHFLAKSYCVPYFLYSAKHRGFVFDQMCKMKPIYQFAELDQFHDYWNI